MDSILLLSLFLCLLLFVPIMLVVGGFLPSHPLTAHIYVKTTLANLWWLVQRLLVWRLLVPGLLVQHLPVWWLLGLAVLVDGFGFSGGWFSGFVAAGLPVSGFVGGEFGNIGF